MSVTPAELFQVSEPAAHSWPITYRWHVSAPWGLTQQELSIDVPALEGDEGKSRTFGPMLWRTVVAPATTFQTYLVGTDVVCWKGLAAPLPHVHVPVGGVRGGDPCSRENTPQVVLHTGHTDDMARRRFFLAGAPESWVGGRMVTLEGWDELESWWNALGVFARELVPGAPAQLLIAYPNLLPTSVENPTGVGFRKVVTGRGTLHAARAPDPSGASWP